MKVFGHYVYFPIVLLAVAEFAVAAAAFASSVFVLQLQIGSADLVAELLWAVGFGLTVVAGLTAVGLYQAKQRLRIEGVLARIVVGLVIAAVCLALVNFFLNVGLRGGLWISSFAISFVTISVERAILWRFLDLEVFQRRVLVFGAGKRAASLLKLRRRSDKRGFNVVAFVPAKGDQRTFDDPRVVELDRPILEYAVAHGVDEVVVAMDDRRAGFPIAELQECRLAGIAVVELFTFLERETGKVNVELVNPSWLIFSDALVIPTRLKVLTRVVDLAVAIPLVVLALPVMAIIALAILIDDGRPVLYRQTRVGLMGKHFTLSKFRSMVRNAEAGGTPQWAQKGDSRVTRFGSILRKSRLDELPQLFNVLVGSMSLVGPRPERPEFVERLATQIPYYLGRHVVKPGITGWAQLSYPYGASDQDALEKLQYDLYYIKHKSAVFDLMVLLQTAEVVLWGKGAR